MGKTVYTFRRVWDPHKAQQFNRAVARLYIGHFLMLANVFDDLVTNAVDRVETRHRFLENHRHPVAHDAAPFTVRKRQQIHTIKADIPASDPHGGAPQKSHNRQRSKTFATTTFTNDAQSFIVINVKGHALNNWQKLALCPDGYLKILNLQQCHVIRPPQYRL